VGVAELGDGLGLADQARPGLAFAQADAGAQELERDPPIELGIVGGEDHAHAAGADPAQDHVAADRVADRDGRLEGAARLAAAPGVRRRQRQVARAALAQAGRPASPDRYPDRPAPAPARRPGSGNPGTSPGAPRPSPRPGAACSSPGELHRHVVVEARHPSAVAAYWGPPRIYGFNDFEIAGEFRGAAAAICAGDDSPRLSQNSP
jgi:hypothetical protein